VLISAADTSEDVYDSTAAWRERAVSGVLHSGILVDDPDPRIGPAALALPALSPPPSAMLQR
jgi:hypothetical protein